MSVKLSDFRRQEWRVKCDSLISIDNMSTASPKGGHEGQVATASGLAIPDQAATPMDDIRAAGNPMSDAVEGVEDNAVANVGNDGYSTDENESSALVAESGFGPGQEPTAAESRLLKGRKFHSWQEFDNALDEYEASSGTVVRRIYRSKTVFTGRCRGWSKDRPDACKMELCARLMKKTGLITIRRVYLIHTCIQDIHKWRNGRNRARWVAKKVMRIVKVNRDTTIEQLQQDLREYHMADSKQWSVQRARMACREKLGGGHKESFSQIPAYASRLRQADPGVHVVWNVSDSHRFEGIFIAPSSSQHAFQFCRPIVGLDGAHISGDYPMVALLATCHDGENDIVTLAWAIVPTENSENWSWFLKELRACYPSMSERGSIFISDRDKGLKPAVAEVFPDHLHSYCVQHIKAQLKTITDLDCVAYFEKVVAAKTRVEFEELLNEFEPQSERQSGLVPYVRKVDPTLYARHAFPAPRYGHTASNVMEVVNAAIRPNKKLPALLLCHEIWLYCMETHFKRKQHGDGLPSEKLCLTDFAKDMLSKLTIKSNYVKERTSSLDQALMVDRYGSYALRVAQKHCDCMDWQEMQFPCAHLITFERDKGRDVRQHADKYWLASNYKQTYSIPVAPISIDRLDRDTSCGEPDIDPDLKKKQQSRKKSVPTHRDNLILENERRVRKQNQKCSGCKKPGHNLRRCPFAPPNPVDEALLPVANVEPLDSMEPLEGPPQDLAAEQSETQTLSYSEWWAQRNAGDPEESVQKEGTQEASLVCEL
ncbi:unnamed protein product [Calypogeia fissa]